MQGKALGVQGNGGAGKGDRVLTEDRGAGGGYRRVTGYWVFEGCWAAGGAGGCGVLRGTWGCSRRGEGEHWGGMGVGGAERL